MRLSVILFLCVVFFEISAGFMVNLPQPGSEGGDALRATGLTLLRPAEPAVELLDQNYKITGSIEDSGRMFVYTMLSIVLNLVVARFAIRVLAKLVNRSSAKSEHHTVKALSRAGM